MNKPLIASLLSSLLIAGCAETPELDAPIEERSNAAVSTSKPASAQPTETAQPPEAGQGSPAGGVEAAALPAEGQVAPAEGAVTAAGVDPSAVETSALPDGQGVAGVSATEMAANAAQAGQSPLKDPDSILSKRVILFDFDSSTLRDEYHALVEAHAQYLMANKEARMIVQGHTDERGSREYNIALGQRRAESVSKVMALLGVGEVQIEPVSLGEEKPVSEGHDESAWQQNRRVELHYQGE